MESKLWKLRPMNAMYVQVTQKASGTTRMVLRSSLPSDEKLAQMHERAFDAACRKAFHKEG